MQVDNPLSVFRAIAHLVRVPMIGWNTMR
ncbi:hypothetical protein TGAM01_v200135 [Trichoderma gamsii]|uniref:Uncharacterized protein n=1 Tax=Trichoderma gamsii TaxID=398673 RepID=A0A2P5A2F4_9HYPO|nr:hypothetical protein TGAM01_v200135 [Trichoderma gamsii]